jgi:predicted butyrate kinase (DUF1464 family)
MKYLANVQLGNGIKETENFDAGRAIATCVTPRLRKVENKKKKVLQLQEELIRSLEDLRNSIVPNVIMSRGRFHNVCSVKTLYLKHFKMQF